MPVIKKYGDIISGSFIIAFSAAMFISTFGIKMLTVSRIGAAFMPRIAAGLFAATGVVILLDGIKKLRVAEGKGATEKGGGVQSPAVRKHAVIATLVIILLYILLLEKIGFIIMTSLYLFAQFYILAGKEERKIPTFIISAILVSVVIYFVFVNGFLLMLPEGILDLN